MVTYLGHHFCQLHSKTEAYKEIVEKLENKLTGWRKKTLSMVGTLTLVKAVVEAILAYIMQVIMLSKSILLKVDKTIRNFMWGH